MVDNDPNHSDVEQKAFRRFIRHDKLLPECVVEQLWNEPDELVDQSEMVKNGDRTTVVRVRHENRSWILKRYNLKNSMHSLLHAGMRTRARRCWGFGRKLQAAGINTPKPVAIVEQRFGPLRFRSFLMTEFVEGSLLADLADHSTQGVVNRLSEEYAELWNQLEQLRIRHGDTKATNVIVAKDQSLWLIDLDAMMSFPIDWLFQHYQKRDWDRFMRNWKDAPVVAEAFEQALEHRKAA